MTEAGIEANTEAGTEAGGQAGTEAGAETVTRRPAAPAPMRPAADRDSAPWWAALGRHEVCFQRCADCRVWRWPARAMCGACGSFGWAWERASGRGTVASWIVTRHAFLPQLPSPYVVVMVRQDEQDDLLLPGGFTGPPDSPGLRIGAPVTAVFADLPCEDGEEPMALLNWAPATTGPATDPAGGPATDPAHAPATDPACRPATDPAGAEAGAEKVAGRPHRTK